MSSFIKIYSFYVFFLLLNIGFCDIECSVARWLKGEDNSFRQLTNEEMSSIANLNQDIDVIEKFNINGREVIKREKKNSANMLAHEGTLYVNNCFPITRVLEKFENIKCRQLCHVLGLTQREIALLKKAVYVKSEVIQYNKETDKTKKCALVSILANKLSCAMKDVEGKIKEIEDNFKGYVAKINEYLDSWGSSGKKVESNLTSQTFVFNFHYVHTEYLLFTDLIRERENWEETPLAFVSCLHMCQQCEEMVVDESSKISAEYSIATLNNPKVIVVSFRRWDKDRDSEGRNNPNSKVLKVNQGEAK